MTGMQGSKRKHNTTQHNKKQLSQKREPEAKTAGSRQEGSKGRNDGEVGGYGAGRIVREGAV